MPYPIEHKLVVGVSSNALFNLENEHEIFKNKGVSAYRDHQVKNVKVPLEKGLAFPFINRFLNINNVYNDEKPVEVVLLSKNSPETGLRIMNSIKHYGLDITRAAFTSGISPYMYINAYNITLFLTTSDNDVRKAVEAKLPAGRFIKTEVNDDPQDSVLRVAFDFDGVLADDESEKVFQTKSLDSFHEHEIEKVELPHNPGPLSEFFKGLSRLQKLETEKEVTNPNYSKVLRTAIVTARNAPSHEKAVNTLSSWGVTVDEMFFLGGIEKKRILEVFKPQIFFDDQESHLDPSIRNIPLVHIPFGIANQ